MPSPFVRIGATLVALLVCGAGAGADTPPDFGNPPSGEVPILFNDHTVYATPDLLTHDRVLAALVKDGEIYVPLRSMFEQMGATVTTSADGNTITATKPGSSVSVTLGKPEVVINGESRPLDVPPMLYHGVVLVPVRVISEGLGAYVQWVQDRRIVVVRYIPLATPPPPAPTAPPTAPPPPPPVVVPPPAPTASPTPVPVEKSYTMFVQGAYSRPQNYNEFVAGGFCDSWSGNFAYAPLHSAFAIKADWRQDSYITSSNTIDAFGNHYTQFATIDGGTAFTPVFWARQTTIDVRLEFQVFHPRYYVGVGYLHAWNNYGYPNLNGVGFGVEKLPDLRPGISFYGSVFYYPGASGTYTVPNPASVNFGASYRQQYNVLKYDVGVAAAIQHSPVYVYGGFSGDQYSARQNAPIGQTHAGPYIGLGVKI